MLPGLELHLRARAVDRPVLTGADNQLLAGLLAASFTKAALALRATPRFAAVRAARAGCLGDGCAPPHEKKRVG